MSDEDSGKGGIPVSTWIAIATALGSVLFLVPPLDSRRPPSPLREFPGQIGDQRINARLWQDPLAAVDEKKETKEKSFPATTDDIHNEIFGSEPEPEKVKLIGVMVPGGPYSEDLEVRLRTRQAIALGLNESSYVPVDGEHLGSFQLDWPPRLPQKKKAKPFPLSVPFEWWRPINERYVKDSGNRSRILLVWIRDSCLADLKLGETAPST